VKAEAIVQKLFPYIEERHAPLFIVDEFGWHPADVYAVNQRRLGLEYEIKVSLSDLKYSEPKKEKWRSRRFESEIEQKKGTVPNYFYFVITPELVYEGALIIKEKYPLAGIILVDDGVKSIHRCKRIHKYPVPDRIIDKAIKTFYYRYRGIRVK
jgi:hypothetical protein